MSFRYSKEQVPLLLYRAVHGCAPFREPGNIEGGTPYRNPAHLGDEVAERLDILDAWRRVPSGPMKRLYWAVVVEERALSPSARMSGVAPVNASKLIEQGSEWIAYLLNNKEAA